MFTALFHFTWRGSLPISRLKFQEEDGEPKSFPAESRAFFSALRKCSKALWDSLTQLGNGRQSFFAQLPYSSS